MLFRSDYYASQHIRDVAPSTYSQYKAAGENRFLTFKTVGLDGAKVGVLEDNGKELARAGALLAKEGKQDANHAALATWWAGAQPTADQDKKSVGEASLIGSRMALKITAAVPAVMALLYLGLILYFRMTGGYKALHVSDKPETRTEPEPVHA